MSGNLFWDENFDGYIHGFNVDIPNLEKVAAKNPGSNWNDETSSIIVFEGTWLFFEHIEYKGLSIDLGPGRYPNITQLGLPDNSISSLKRVG
jgi:Beta/Gamma crystallin